MQQKTKKLDSTIALRQAGLVGLFMWQDEAAAGDLDAKTVGVDYATVLGTLPEKVNGAPVYLVHVQGTATSTFGYSYPIERTLKIYLRPSDEDGGGEPLAEEATEEDEAACEQHGRDLACKEYAELSHIVEVGAYSEGDSGQCWYPDEENGIDVSARLLELESAALEEGLHFAPSSPVRSDGYADTYKLEPATQEEIDIYKKAKAEAEAAEDEEE
jgi:hypothetical protein